MRLAAPRTLEVCEADLPRLAEGQIQVRTDFSGISGGTEMLAYRGEIDPTIPLDETLGALAGTFTYPFSYGYSCVGRVEASMSPLSEGTLVFAFHPHQDRFVVDAADAVVVEGIRPRLATLLPLAETALQATLDAGCLYGDAVAVMGLGAVGILVGALLQRAGARVIGSDPQPWRRSAAESLGVRAVHPDELDAAVKEATDERGVDLVVEATGNPQALSVALRLLAHEGTALVCSWYGTKRVTLPLGAEFHRRRLSIRSTQVSTIPGHLTARWDRARRRTAARSMLEDLPISALATHEFPFERAADAYAAIDRGEPGLIHAALRYQ